MTDLICISCPKGCHLRVDEQNDYAVTGNSCPRGETYGRSELVHPVRIVTSTVRVEGGVPARLPVKTDRPLEKEKMFDCMRLINSMSVKAPVTIGQILCKNILDTDVNLVATKTIC